MSSNLIGNELLLNEDYRVDDILDFSGPIAELENLFAGLSNTAVVGLIGKFGSGKSTLLNLIRRRGEPERKERWFEFDAWKYPERNNMWEGFVLDIAAQYGARTQKNALRSIKGKDAKSVWFDIGTDALTWLTDIVQIQILDKFIEFFKKSPATRVFEIQEILYEILNAEESDIFIVAEDLDRSGDKGVYFLETLRHFLKSKKFKKRVIVIVPIGEEVYSGQLETSYGKCLDYFFRLRLDKIGYTKFAEAVFSPEITRNPNHLKQITFLLTQVAGHGLVIRSIKRALRIGLIQYNRLTIAGPLDPRVFLYFVFLNYLNEFPFSHQRDNKPVLSANKLGGAFLIWVANSDSMTDIAQLSHFRDWPILGVDQDNLLIPTIPTFSHEKNAYFLSSRYLQISL